MEKKWLNFTWFILLMIANTWIYFIDYPDEGIPILIFAVLGLIALVYVFKRYTEKKNIFYLLFLGNAFLIFFGLDLLFRMEIFYHHYYYDDDGWYEYDFMIWLGIGIQVILLAGFIYLLGFHPESKNKDLPFQTEKEVFSSHGSVLPSLDKLTTKSDMTSSYINTRLWLLFSAMHIYEFPLQVIKENVKHLKYYQVLIERALSDLGFGINDHHNSVHSNTLNDIPKTQMFFDGTYVAAPFFMVKTRKAGNRVLEAIIIFIFVEGLNFAFASMSETYWYSMFIPVAIIAFIVFIIVIISFLSQRTSSNSQESLPRNILKWEDLKVVISYWGFYEEVRDNVEKEVIFHKDSTETTKASIKPSLKYSLSLQIIIGVLPNYHDSSMSISMSNRIDNDRFNASWELLQLLKQKLSRVWSERPVTVLNIVDSEESSPISLRVLSFDGSFEDLNERFPVMGRTKLSSDSSIKGDLT